MLLRIRGKSQYGLPVKRGWHKGILPLLAIAGKAALVGGGVAAGKGLMTKFFGGGKDKRRGYNLPDFAEDPYYKKSQEALFPFGRDLLAGDIPDYYKPIGEIGGELFEDVLGLGIKDIKTAGIETAARFGRRGGNVAPGIAGKVGEFTKRARFDDLMRALKGRGFLLGAGADMLSGVRGGALTFQGQKNIYEISKGNLALGYAGLEDKRDAAKGEAIGSGISSLANLYSMYQLGKVKKFKPDLSKGTIT